MVIHIIDKKAVMYTDILNKYITLKLKISDKEKNILVLRCENYLFYEIEDIEYEKDGYSIVTARPSLDIEGITVCEMVIFQEFVNDFTDNGQATGEYSNELKELVLDVINGVFDKQQSLTQEESEFLRNIISSGNSEKNKQFLDMTNKIISQHTEKEKKIYNDFANELIKKKKTKLINLICCCKINRLDYEKLHQAVEEAGVSVDYRIRKKRSTLFAKQKK